MFQLRPVLRQVSVVSEYHTCLIITPNQVNMKKQRGGDNRQGALHERRKYTPPYYVQHQRRQLSRTATMSYTSRFAT